MKNSPKLRIVLSSNSAETIYNFRLGIIKTFLKKGCEVFIIAPRDEATDKLKDCGCVCLDLPIEGRSANPFKDFFIIQKYTQIYKKIKPNLAFHYTVKPAIYGAIAARLAGIPSISVITGLGYAFIVDNWIAKIVRFLYRQALKFPLETWFLNQDDLEVFVKQKLIALNKSFVLPGEGVDTDFFKPKEEAERNTINFLMIARLIWDKGIKEFVEAAQIIIAKYSHVKFQLLGATTENVKNGVSIKRLNQWITAGTISYLGVAQDVRDFIAQADCVILPSYREGIPRSLLEASSMAKPIIATNTAGCREVVLEQKSGLLCEVKNAQSLADQMERIVLMDNVSKKEMGLAGRQYIIERFDEDKVINIYLEKLRKFNLPV